MSLHPLKRGSFCLAWLLAAALAAPAEGGKTAAWRHRTAADFQAGALEGLVLSADGGLTLARRTRLLADLQCGSVWDLARARSGRLWAATALPGQVVEIADDGKVKVLWKDPQQQVFSLVAAADGGAYFGAAPHGTIYRLAPDGKVTQFAKLDCLYIWDLALDAEGRLLAATGPQGAVFRIASDGKSERFCETRQQHVLCLIAGGDGGWLAGTDGSGLVLSIDAQGKARALLDTRAGEVRALWREPAGTIFAGTAGGAVRGMSAAATEGGSGGASSGGSGGASSAGGRSHVYRIAADGAARPLLQTPGMIYTVAPLGAAAEGQLLVGTGGPGALQIVASDGGEAREAVRLDDELFLASLGEPGGRVLVGSGNPGRVYLLEAESVAEGTLVSKSLDAGGVARFGAIEWRAEVSPQTQIAVAARSGQTEQPDDQWSAWSTEQTDPQQAAAGCPPGRFLQYRLTLRTRQPQRAPVLRGLVLHYLTSNQPPQITRLTAPHVEDGDGKKPLEKLKLEWEAKDPNGDDLTFDLSFRKPEWKNWLPLKSRHADDEFEWDTRGVPEGTYLLRLEASDAGSNPPQEGLLATRISEPFVVDRTGPAVEVKLAGIAAGRTALFTAEARDAASRVVSAAYAVDGGDWVSLFPEDGLFDTPRERFRFSLAGLAEGTHVIVVRATDAAGFIGSNDVAFEIAAGK